MNIQQGNTKNGRARWGEAGRKMWNHGGWKRRTAGGAAGNRGQMEEQLEASH